jgi:hypothetical protein
MTVIQGDAGLNGHCSRALECLKLSLVQSHRVRMFLSINDSAIITFARLKGNASVPRQRLNEGANIASSERHRVNMLIHFVGDGNGVTTGH